MMFAQACDEVGVMFGARAALRNKNCVRQTQLRRGGDPGSFGDVGKDDGDFDAVQATFADAACDGEEVGAAPGEEDS
jgi:hypothetical protein